MATMAEKVQAGIKFLDTHPDVPGSWRSLIDLSNFDMGDGSSCLIAQLQKAAVPSTVDYDRYYKGLDRLGLTDPEGYRLGFNCDSNPGPLTRAWKEALSETPTAEVMVAVNSAEGIVSLLDGLTLKQLRANQKVLDKTLAKLRKDLTL